MTNDEIGQFLENVYTLVANNNEQAATDLVFDCIDRLLSDGEFPTCDAILRNVDIDRLSSSLMRSFLCITLSAKRDLPFRHLLYWNIKQSMTYLKGQDKTERLIGWLA